MNTSIKILGTTYAILFKSEAEDKLLIDCDGYCDKTSKTIVIDNLVQGDCNLDDPHYYLQKNVRHEVIHAFMYESGLAENWEHKRFGQDETVVDWFAWQLPKINKALSEAGWKIT